MELEIATEFVLGNGSGSYQDLESNSSFFDFSYIEPFLVSECNVAPRLNLTGKKQNIIEELLNEIYDEYSQKADSYLLALKADLLKLLVLLGRYFRKDVEQQSDVIELYNHHRDALTKAILYIDIHYSESITIEDISHIAMLSQSYFSFLFKTVTNKTFVEYLNSRRIQHAMEMLNQTDELVVDVCFESGFKNVNHFNRTFKNIVGISPTQFRKANRKIKTSSN
jgi:AraC-like DNA-binding protein